MKERPIIFSGPMVRAILEDRKTQTRRIVKKNPMKVNCPYGKVGDRLWVRETCAAEELDNGIDGVRYKADSAFIPIENSAKAADQWGDLASYGMKKSGRPECRTVPSIHMPRWASRITLEITDIRVERLQDISESDAKAEGAFLSGVENGNYDANGFPIETGTYIEDFYCIWESINGAGSWNKNPWVWVIEFKRID